jgi:hypothetical protein
MDYQQLLMLGLGPSADLASCHRATPNVSRDDLQSMQPRNAASALKQANRRAMQPAAQMASLPRPRMCKNSVEPERMDAGGGKWTEHLPVWF